MSNKSIHSSHSTASSYVSTPWSDALKQCYRENYGSKGIQTSLPLISSINNIPSIKHVEFASFCETDERAIIFAAKCNNSTLIGNIRSSKGDGSLLWNFAKTGNRYTFTGKSYLVAAPSLSHRFGTPPKRISLPEDVSPEMYWEYAREKVWSSLTSQARASYTWPSSSSTKHAIDGIVESSYERRSSSSKVGQHMGLKELNFNMMRLDEIKNFGPVTLEAGQKMTRECIHNQAKDNLCLVVFKVQSVEVYEPASSTFFFFFYSQKDILRV
jgi:hypothetical protein